VIVRRRHRGRTNAWCG